MFCTIPLFSISYSVPALQKIRPDCWTQYFRDHGTRLRDVPRQLLCQKDTKTNYTIVHAICSSLLKLKIIFSQFQVLDELQLMGKITAKDRDGDMPLQSAVLSNADVPTVKFILNYVPGSKMIMLQNRNKANETALERSIFSNSTGVFKFLLKECIECEILTDLTCVGITRNLRCSTLVHKCIRHRRIDWFRAFLEVCRECGVKPDLCVENEKGFTPWQYLLRYSNKELKLVENVFSILTEYGIHMSSLLVNKRNRESLLHAAYRIHNKALIKRLVEKDETCKKKFDRYKRTPLQMIRILDDTDESQPQTDQDTQPTTQCLPQLSQARPQPTTQHPPQPSQARPQRTTQRPPQPSQARPQPTTQRPPQPSQARLQPTTQRPPQPSQARPQPTTHPPQSSRLQTSTDQSSESREKVANTIILQVPYKMTSSQ